MSNLDLWYFVGIFIVGASFSYIAYSAALLMGLRKRDQKAGGTQPENSPQTQFLRHALLAFAGIMLGAQLLQYHQDQKEIAIKDMGRDIALAQAASARGAAPAAATAGAAGLAAANPAGLGMRPTTRPPRGYFSIAEAEKAAAAKVTAAAAAAVASAVVSTPAAVPVVPAVPVLPVAPAVTAAK